MMRRLSTFLTLAIFLVSGLAQIYGEELISFEEDSIYKTGDAGEFEFVAYNRVTNHTDDTLEVQWSRISNDIPEDWNSAVCDTTTCWMPEVDDTTFTMAPEAPYRLDVHFRPFDQVGEGKVEVEINILTEGFETDAKGVYYGQAEPSTSVRKRKKAFDINFYPNPVDENLNVEFGNLGRYTVEVYNVLGKKVYRNHYNNEQHTSINLKDEPKGVYMLRVENRDTGERLTKRFSKE